MGTRVGVAEHNHYRDRDNNSCTRQFNCHSSANNNEDEDDEEENDENIRSAADSYISNNNSLDDHDHNNEAPPPHDEGSNTVDDCLEDPYKNSIEIPAVGIEDDHSSLESSGPLRTCSNVITTKDLLPIETARARFLQIILDHFISEHLIEKRADFMENIVEHGEDKLNKRKSGDVQYEGDPRFVLPLMYVANLYETLVNEANIRLSSLHGLREKTIGMALEASGGLYRKLTQKFPKTGPYSFKRRELATSLETRTRFPELVVQEAKRVRFVVANGLEIVEKPNGVLFDDADWFKRLTGRSEVAITARDYKFYNPRHKVRRASANTSPTVAIMHSYHGSSDHDYHSMIESPSEQGTPSKQQMVTLARQPQFEPVNLNHHESLNQSQQTTIIFRAHEKGLPSHMSEISHAHPSGALSQNIGPLHHHAAGHIVGHVTMMPTSPAKFCDECGSPYVRSTSKYCSECGMKRYGI